MNLCSMFAEAGHVWYLCIISNSSNAYANFYDEKKRHYVTCCHVSAHVLPRQRPRAATSTPTECLLAQHVSTYEPNTCQPTSPTRFNQRAQHVSIYQPYTCQPCDHTRVRCKPAETVQWRGKNRHGCNDIYDKIHKIVKVQQLWRYKDDEDDFVIASSQIYVHDVFGLYYDKSETS